MEFIYFITSPLAHPTAGAVLLTGEGRGMLLISGIFPPSPFRRRGRGLRF